MHDIYCDMDGTFPNHAADPTQKKNLLDLINLVKENHLDLGVGYDGDGDRIGVVDKNGEVIYGDQLMVIYAREILQRNPGAVFISEVKCSMVMYDDIKKHGGKAIMWRTGHSLIKKKMKEENAALAGEMSGHMFFKDRFSGLTTPFMQPAACLKSWQIQVLVLMSLYGIFPGLLQRPKFAGTVRMRSNLR